MNRRRLLQVITAGGATLLVAPWLGACGADASDPRCPLPPPASDDPFDGWQGPPDTDDVRLLALSYALLAPNAHNLQSWKVVLTERDTLELYVEPTRLLPASDPPYRQVHISVGAFLEILVLAATHLGHRAELKLFPRGEYGASELKDVPVARVRMVPDAKVSADPLFEHVLARRSGKVPYDGRAVADSELEQLRAALGPGPGTLSWTSEASKVAAIAALSIRASDIDLVGVDRFQETVDVFRFTNQELQQHRNGLDARALGDQGFNRELALANQELARRLTDAQQRGLAGATPSWGWLTTPTSSRRDQLLTGRQYVRLNLAAAGRGISIHPNSQALQEYDDMAETQRELLTTLDVTAGHTVQMLVRMGYGPSSAPSARKRWADFTACS